MSGPLDHFSYRKNVLCADGVSLEEIADATGTPVYVYSADAFLAPLRELQKGLRDFDHLVCFAVKSNSNVAVLKLLSDAGAGTDLVSGGELFRARMAGVPADRIVLSGVGKTAGEIAQALEYEDGRGIFSFNVESESELALIQAVAAQIGKTARVALRFNPDVDAKTHPYISTGLKRDKFGMNRKEVLSILRRLKAENWDHVKLRGLSIHIGSQILSLSPLNDAFRKARAMLEEIESSTGEPLPFIDVGGGIGVAYRNEKPIPIAKYCSLVKRHFEKRKDLKILLEPGRLISANAGALVTEIVHRKPRSDKEIVIVDAAMNDLIRPALYESYHEIAPVVRRGGKTKKSTDVVGPVCESSDCFASGRKMPYPLERGDLLAILSAGAYGFTMSGNYNSRPRPPEVLVEDGKFRVIRERETYEDLIRGEVLR